MKDHVVFELKRLIAVVEALPQEKRTEFFDEIENELKGVTVRNGDTFQGFAYRTKNLDQFKHVVGNRLINENSHYVKKLAESIARIGNITPIIINEKNEIIDGQRRIAAIRKYELPNDVTYLRKIGTDIETVGDINQLQLKWSYKDWLHKYVEHNKPDYIKYQGIADKYERYMKSRSLRGLLMNNRVDPLASDVWESGNFTINHKALPFIKNFLDTLIKVHNIGDKENIFAKDRNFQKALFEVIRTTKVIDEERLLQKIRFGFGRLNIKTDYPTYRKIIGELYNSRLNPTFPSIIINEPQSGELPTARVKRKYTKRVKTEVPTEAKERIKRKYTKRVKTEVPVETQGRIKRKYTKRSKSTTTKAKVRSRAKAEKELV